MRNAINWFEIPASDFERAVAFYEQILAKPLHRELFMGVQQAFLPFDHQTGGVGGSIVAQQYIENNPVIPSSTGSVLYLNADGQIDAMLERIVAAGGAIITPATPIPPTGQIAVFRDSEGNRIGLHQS
jgi:hypothetical protein